MKKLFLCIAGIFAVATIAAASSVCVSTEMAVSTTPGLFFTCGDVTFSNFYLSDLSGNNTGVLDINSVSINDQGLVTFSENPNLISGGRENLTFSITGALNAIDVLVGGSTATVAEKVCANAIAASGPSAGLCSSGSLNSTVAPVGQLAVHSLDPIQEVAPGINTSGPIHIFQTIAAGAGNLGAVFQGFGDPADVPEPVTLVLLGSALAFIGLAGRHHLHRD
jgi:hypothetical protein